VNNASSILQIL